MKALSRLFTPLVVSTRSVALCIGMMVALSLLTYPAPTKAQNPFTLDVMAPELVGGPWLNTTKNAPIKLASLKGKVTVVEFWTFG